jgi:hypothetical protein
MVRDQGQDFAELGFGSREGRHGIAHKISLALANVHSPRPVERVDVVGSGGQRAIEKASGLRCGVTRQTLVEQSQALKIKVHRVGVRGPFGAPRLGCDEFGVQRVRQTRDDLVLHVEQICERLVEPLGPEMIASLRVDQLHIDAHAVSAALNAALEHIAYVQIAPDLLQVDGFALVSESGVASDHERTPYPREVGRQALGDPIDEVLLLRAASHVGERQNDHREAGKTQNFRRGAGGRRRGARRVIFDSVRSHGPRNVFQGLLTEVDEFGVDPPAYVLVGRARDQHAARLADRFEPRRDVDALPQKCRRPRSAHRRD